MNKSILVAAMVAVALTACGEDKKHRRPSSRRHLLPHRHPRPPPMP